MHRYDKRARLRLASGTSLLLVVAAGICRAAGPAPSAAESSSTDVSTDWWNEVQRGIAASEYHLSELAPATDGGEPDFAAPNRAQNFRAYFEAGGVRVIPRDTGPNETPAWEWRIALAGWGRGGATVQRSAQPERLVAENRVEYRWGSLTEWYVNDAHGLEQGFTIERRPGAAEAHDSASDLRLELSVGGDLHASLADEGQAVDFVNRLGARPIRFDHLSVVDARRRALPARFELTGDGAARHLAIVVDDRDAVYPVTIDPLATSPSWSAQPNQAGAEMGLSLATAGDVNGDGCSDVVVGAHKYDNGQTDEGRVYVFLGSSAGLSSTAAWTAESDQASSDFGYSVATAGDVNGDGFDDVIIGARFFDNGQSNEGRAYVYYGSAAGLSASPNWTSESNQLNGYFGESVSTAGDVNGDGFGDVIVGARGFDNDQTDQGRVFVYHGSAGGLSVPANWTAEGNATDARFGSTVSTAGDVNGDGFDDVIVGAPSFTSVLFQQGQVVVYHGSPSGLSGFNWVTMGASAGMQYGRSVSTAGDVNGDGYSDVVIGAPFFDGDLTDEGKAFVYLGSATGLSTNGSSWAVEGNQTTALFGCSVSTAGDVNGDGYSEVIVGAYLASNGQSHEGRAYVYAGAASGLKTTPSWIGEADQANAWYGMAVGTAGDVNGDGFSEVIVGAPFMDEGEGDEGRAMVYYGAGAGLSPTPNWAITGDQAVEYLGYSIASAGDVNGDGFSDVIVGAPGYDTIPPNGGRAYVYHGSPTGLSTVANWMAQTTWVDAWMGQSVATAGDVNGDGFSDVIVGAPGYLEGRAYVYHGSASGLGTSPAWTAQGLSKGNWFGYVVSTAGDVNADGYSDVVIGSYWATNGLYVYHGSPVGLEAAPNAILAETAVTLASAGDVNGDGFSDVIAGSPGYSNGESGEGHAFLYYGSSAGVGATAGWAVEGDVPDLWFGNCVASAGDVNGDGFSDVIVGAPGYANGQQQEGRAYVYHGAASGLGAVAAWVAEGDSVFASLGSSVASAGDVNADGFSDVVVGAPGYVSTIRGKAYLYYGSATSVMSTPSWTAHGDVDARAFGTCVAGAGDVNGDGFGDLIVSDLGKSVVGESVGRVFAYYGNGGGGLAFRPRQAQSDDSSPIALLGASDSENDFRIKVSSPSTGGLGDPRLQFEVKPAGVPFDGTGLVTGPAGQRPEASGGVFRRW